MAGRQLSPRPAGGSPPGAASCRADCQVTGRRRSSPQISVARPRVLSGILPRRESCRRAKITVKGARCAHVADAMAQAPPLTLIFPGKDPAPIGEDADASESSSCAIMLIIEFNALTTER